MDFKFSVISLISPSGSSNDFQMRGGTYLKFLTSWFFIFKEITLCNSCDHFILKDVFDVANVLCYKLLLKNCFVF